jgi:hypothetical protein
MRQVPFRSLPVNVPPLPVLFPPLLLLPLSLLELLLELLLLPLPHDMGDAPMQTSKSDDSAMAASCFL